MPHTLNQVWIHAVWSTKLRLPLINRNMEEKIFEHIRKQLEDMGCRVSIINGMPNHIHCLFRLSTEKTIAEVMKQIKGSSSHFINQQKLIDKKFAWQSGYGVFSVSTSAIPIVHAYIKNQKNRGARNHGPGIRPRWMRDEPGISIPGGMDAG